MDSFLDDYQKVRLALSLIGLAILLAFAASEGFASGAPFSISMGVIGGHALWCRLRHIRSPRSMLLLDTTVWGVIMVLAEDPSVSAVVLAFLAVLVALFSDGAWRAAFLTASAGWYGLSVFGTDQLVPVSASSSLPSMTSLGHVMGVLLITGGMAAMIIRVRGWLGQLDAGRSQMLGTVSHELRNNLTGMIGLTEVVSTNRELNADEARELVALAHQQAVDANEIVEDLLTATRLERAALSIAMKSVNINDEVDTTARRFSGEGIDLSVRKATDLPPAAADGLRVRQVLRNLVSNAVRYGGSSIRITTVAVGDEVKVTIADDGEGVPPEDETTIFLPYRRSTRSSHAASVGLGLWISRQLAVAMGGSLDYRRVDGWTEFVLTLGAYGRDTGYGILRLEAVSPATDLG
ncbi:MAG: sensor histidine kinase [Acidimicrobiia bacterium]